MELIDRQAVLALAKDVTIVNEKGDTCKHRCVDATEILLMPAVEERKTGKWVEVHLSHPRYGGDAVIYRCSICGWAVSHKVPKCRCGAKMEVDE